MIANITIFNASSGKIIKSCMCTEQDIALQFDPLIENYIFGAFDSREYYIDNGNPVAIPVSPFPYYVFDYTAKQWVDPRTLDQVKDTQWTAIKRARDGATYTPIATPFGTFDANPRAQKSITDAVLMLQTMAAMGTPTTIDFTLADNTTATLTTAQMVQVGLLLGAQTQAAHAKARALRARIDAATTATAVQAVTWS